MAVRVQPTIDGESKAVHRHCFANARNDGRGFFRSKWQARGMENFYFKVNRW